MTIFQILLCTQVCCVGVSIIWCATLGWILMLLRYTMNSKNKVFNPNNTKRRKYSINAAMIAIGADSLAILYYGIVAEAITTVAHVCAVLLGIVLWYLLSLSLCNKRKTE